MTTDNTDMAADAMAQMGRSDVLIYIVEHALELSELALVAGQPQASALLTLAAFDLRRIVG